jgi:hypothetical protein
MKSWVLVGLVGLFIGVSTGGGAEEPTASHQGLSSWLIDYDSAKTLARQLDKPLFVVFR